MEHKIWNKLLAFESRDLIARYIKQKFQRDCSARQVSEISSNFIQGREYFRNAEQAAITVKPLLHYYGVSALTRGMILATSPHLSESSLKPSHGLETINWRETLVKKDFGNLCANIRQGTFYDLLSSTANKAYFKHNSSALNWGLNYDVPPQGASIKFSELIRTMPDFQEAYEVWTQQQLHQLRLQEMKTPDTGVINYKISKPHNNENAIAEVFPENVYGSYRIHEEGGYLKLSLPSASHPHFSQSFEDSFNAGIGEIRLTKPIGGQVYLSPVAQFYALSFFLGMLSRYFPSVWVSLGRTEKGDAIYPLFNAAIELIDKNFPSIIWGYLNGPYPFEK